MILAEKIVRRKKKESNKKRIESVSYFLCVYAFIKGTEMKFLLLPVLIPENSHIPFVTREQSNLSSQYYLSWWLVGSGGESEKDGYSVAFSVSLSGKQLK